MLQNYDGEENLPKDLTKLLENNTSKEQIINLNKQKMP